MRNDSTIAPLSSTFARVGWLFYVLLIVYASWYPFSGWQDIGISPFAYVMAPMPQYWTKFDVLTNIAGYLPLGTLGVFALYPRARGLLAFVLVVVFGVLLAGTMEAVQIFLPSRVPSNLDLISNAIGVFLGAIAGVLLTQALMVNSRTQLTRRRWFANHAGGVLIMVALWPVAQIYPQGYLFGHGQLTPILSDWISRFSAVPIDLGDIVRRGEQLTVEQYWLSEAIITACGLTGALLALLSVLRERAPKKLLVVVMFASAVTARSLATALQFSPENAFAWLTPGAQGGLLLGMVMLSGLVFAPAVAQRRVAVMTLCMSLVVVNLAPANPYFVATLQTWVQGKFLNFNGAAQFLALAWPFFMLGFLLRRVRPAAHRAEQE